MICLFWSGTVLPGQKHLFVPLLGLLRNNQIF
nr:MAG TPA: hypothetical protein [Caudoviricetes sp.]